ncbi:hypothetical protein A9R05_40735 (plasmid) [Burkholderia sp. KK1]|nr:hypothetical protein A9R05_40735 [Burkholderia sp. KK1]
MAVLNDERFAVSMVNVRAIPGRPGKVTFELHSQSSEPLEFIKSAVEVRRRFPRSLHYLPSASRGYAVVTAIAPGMKIKARGELPFVINVDRRTGFNGLISAEPPGNQEPSLYLAARLFYRRVNGELYETAVYRRLHYPDLGFSAIDADVAHLNYTGIKAYATPRRPHETAIHQRLCEAP